MTEQNLNPDALLESMDVLMSEVGADPRAGEWARKVATRVVGAYVSASPAQPDTVNSVEELDALPAWSFVQGYDGFKHVKYIDGMWVLILKESSTPHFSGGIELPATVLYRPVK